MTHLQKFFHYIIPATMGMTIISIYFIIDGIFIGRGVGTIGLAAVNLGTPFMAIITAVNMMITMGGATIMSISYGEGNIKKGNDIFLISSIIIFFLALLSIAISIFAAPYIIGLMGATDQLAKEAVIYMRYFMAFGFFMLYSGAISVFIRNDGNPRLVFWATITGAILNVILDYTFIFHLHMGVKGAAIASGLGQTVTLIILLFHFILKKGFLRLYKPNIPWHRVVDICKTGTPEFIMEISFPISLLCYNNMLIRLYGEMSVAAFSIIVYLIWVLRSVFAGISQGVQPLISMAYGERNNKLMHYYFRVAITTGVVIGSLSTIAFWTFGNNVVAIFTKDVALQALTTHGLIIYSISFTFTAIITISIMYLQSIKATKFANIISINRGFTFNILIIVLLPLIFSKDLIWYTITIVEIISILFTVLCIHIRNKQVSKEMSA